MKIPWKTIIFFHTAFLSIINGDFSHGEFDEDLLKASLNVSDMANQLRDMIEHFKRADPIGIPGAPIPDPMPTPDMKYKKSLATLHLKNSKIHGLSKFRIEKIESNLDKLDIDIELSYQKLEVLGNYTISSLFSSRNQGGYNVTILEVALGGIASLNTAKDGHLIATDIIMDLSFKDIKMDFKNSGFFLNAFQGVINHIGGFVFDTIKPYILSEVNTNIKADINKIMSKMTKTFPNSIPPLDLAIAEARKSVREGGYDPFPVEDYKYSTGVLGVTVKDISLSGLASFYRVGNVTVAVKRNSVSVDSDISTEQLEGKCDWQASLGQLLSTDGSTGFTVQYVQVRTRFNQSLDLRNKPILEEMTIRLGNFQLRMDGTGSLDYIMELAANVLPNLLRYEIVEAVQGVIKQRIQTVLLGLDVEQLVEKHVIANLDSVIAPNQTVNDLETSYELTDDNPFDLEELYDEIVF